LPTYLPDGLFKVKQINYLEIYISHSKITSPQKHHTESAMLFQERGANWSETAIYKQFISLPAGFWEGRNRCVWKEGCALSKKCCSGQNRIAMSISLAVMQSGMLLLQTQVLTLFHI